MTITLEELNKQAEEVQRRLDTISNLIKLASLSDKITEIQAIKLHMQQVSQEINDESEKLSKMMNEFKEEKRRMNSLMKAVVMVVLLFVLAFTVSAQDAPLATNTPEGAILPVVATLDGATVAATIEATPLPSEGGVVVSYLPTREDLLDTFMKYGLAIGITLILALTYLFRNIAVHLAMGVPQFAWEGVKGGGNTLLDDLNRRVKDTETPLDDKALELFRQFYDDLVKQVDAARAGATPMALRHTGVPTQEEVDKLRSEMLAKAGIDAPNVTITGSG